MSGASPQFQFRLLTGLLVLLGLALLAVGIYYFVTPAGSLPSFFPGHQAGSAHHHTKHGILAVVLAVAAFIGAWFTTSPRSSPSTK